MKEALLRKGNIYLFIYFVLLVQYNTQRKEQTEKMNEKEKAKGCNSVKVHIAGYSVHKYSSKEDISSFSNGSM